MMKHDDASCGFVCLPHSLPRCHYLHEVPRYVLYSSYVLSKTPSLQLLRTPARGALFIPRGFLQ